MFDFLEAAFDFISEPIMSVVDFFSDNKGILGPIVGAAVKTLGGPGGSPQPTSISQTTIRPRGISVGSMPVQAMGDARTPQSIQSIDAGALQQEWLRRMRSFSQLREGF